METVQTNKASQRPRPRSHGNGHERPALATEQQTASAITQVQINPRMTPCEAGLIVLRAYYRQMLANQGGTIVGTDPEPLHDMRVATNHLRQALRDFRSTFGKENVDPLADDARWLSGLLGSIRDLDVFIEWLRDYEEQAPLDQRPFVRRIVEERERARVGERAALLTGLRSQRYEHFTRALARFLESQYTTPACARGSLSDLAASKITQRLKRVRQARKRASVGKFKRLHRLRIQCKRLRYTVEFFGSLFPRHAPKLIKHARRVQDTLGDVHDSHMHIRFLRAMRRQEVSDPRMCDTLDAMIEVLRDEQGKAFKCFKSEYKKLKPKRTKNKLNEWLAYR